MYKIVLIRHGQTDFNKEKIFCGWTDVDLNENGINEAKNAGINLKKAGYSFDIAFCSVLKRSINTLDIIKKEMGIENLPTKYSWRLNERHYGALQGHRHVDVAQIYGWDQVQIWRRSYNVRPPLLEESDPRYSGNDIKYKDLNKEEIPLGESLEDTIKRVLPYWQEEIVPEIKKNKKIIISASGNSLRALVKYIENINDDDIVGLEIKTGTPLIYELDENLKPIKKCYLAD